MATRFMKLKAKLRFFLGGGAQYLFKDITQYNIISLIMLSLTIELCQDGFSVTPGFFRANHVTICLILFHLTLIPKGRKSYTLF